MNRIAILILILVGSFVTSTAQKPSLELTFTAIDSAAHIQLDSIKVMNRTLGGDTVLYYPDTVLVLDHIVGVEEADDKDEGLQVYQNYPNPVTESTTISIYVPERGMVRCLITDILGTVSQQYEEVLESGVHSFSYTPGGGEMSFFTVIWRNFRETIKILHPTLNKSSSPSLSYIGMSSTPEYESKASEAIQGFSFSLGNTLLYIGYIDEMESGILDAPTLSDTIYLQFATNIPCPGNPMVTYEGQVYNTIQIYSQCWLKENLNVGTMIPGNLEMTNNGLMEKYCYENEPDSCDKYGGLYQWAEMMQYSTQQGGQGICPPGWHLPMDEEWKVLEGAVDSLYGIGDLVWDIGQSYRGFDAGINLKTINGWEIAGNGNGGKDLYGFSGLPGGILWKGGNFDFLGWFGDWWTSTRYDNGKVWARALNCDDPDVARYHTAVVEGHSVRCIKDREE